MSENVEEVTVHLANEKVQFIGVSASNPDRFITFDYKPPIGDGKGFNGLELLLMSLGGCSGPGGTRWGTDLCHLPRSGLCT